MPMKEGSGVSLAIAGGVVALFVVMPAVVVILIYVMITVMALLKAAGLTEHASTAIPILVGVIAIVGTMTTLLAVAMAKIGSSLTPKKLGGRRARRAARA
jgi:hypothetical protein